jgi:hypothetical protein
MDRLFSRDKIDQFINDTLKENRYKEKLIKVEDNVKDSLFKKPGRSDSNLMRFMDMDLENENSKINKQLKVFVNRARELENSNNANISEEVKDLLLKVNDFLKDYFNKYIENNSDNADLIQIMDIVLNNKNDIQKTKKEIVQMLTEKTKKNDLRFRSKEKKEKTVSDLPPEPYSEESGALCKNDSDCASKSKKWTLCTILRVTIRFVYEVIALTMNIIAKIIYGLCACFHTPTEQKISVSCSNTTSIPGLICTVPNQTFQGIFKISFVIWKVYELISQTCFNPMSPLLFS